MDRVFSSILYAIQLELEWSHQWACFVHNTSWEPLPLRRCQPSPWAPWFWVCYLASIKPRMQCGLNRGSVAWGPELGPSSTTTPPNPHLKKPSRPPRNTWKCFCTSWTQLVQERCGSAGFSWCCWADTAASVSPTAAADHGLRLYLSSV